MCLLARVVEHQPTRTVCSVVPRRGDLLADPDGRVPVWVGLEYMAQCVAAHGGLIARSAGRAPRPGLFLGSRRARFGARHFAPDREVRVTVRHHRGERGLVAFDCEIRAGTGGSPLVEARVNVYIVDSWHELGSATP
jgi:predicted hotdog family 3-hydroxylacyl-ACP dehydratase